MENLNHPASAHLDFLCNQLPTRQVGSEGNKKATEYFAEVTRALGYQVEQPSFNCVNWKEDGATCLCGGKSFEVLPSPYSRGCDVNAVLRSASTLAELESIQCQGEVLLLRGELAREQLMPKNYPFYNPKLHQLILALLERSAPAAIIGATSFNPELAGAVYPFPLVEDGNFDIPSVYTTEATGEALSRCAGKAITLVSRAERIPSTGCNVLAHRNQGAPQKIVFCAHIDAKIGTPGALDNAAGVVTLLLTAELLKDLPTRFELEFLAMNGEDYYGANGELLYLAQNEGNLGRIPLFINLDGLGYVNGKTAVSFYNLKEELLCSLRQVLNEYPGCLGGEAWYQGDHMVMVMNGVPAMAVTTELFMEMERKFAHTAADVPSLVDVSKLAETARLLRAVVESLEGMDL